MGESEKSESGNVSITERQGDQTGVQCPPLRPSPVSSLQGTRLQGWCQGDVCWEGAESWNRSSQVSQQDSSPETPRSSWPPSWTSLSAPGPKSWPLTPKQTSAWRREEGRSLKILWEDNSHRDGKELCSISWVQAHSMAVTTMNLDSGALSGTKSHWDCKMKFKIGAKVRTQRSDPSLPSAAGDSTESIYSLCSLVCYSWHLSPSWAPVRTWCEGVRWPLSLGFEPKVAPEVSWGIKRFQFKLIVYQLCNLSLLKIFLNLIFSP